MDVQRLLVGQIHSHHDAEVCDRFEGVGSVGARPTSGVHRPDVASHARAADPSPLSPWVSVGALVRPNCAWVARQRGCLRLDFERTAMSAHFCMGMTPWTLSVGPENPLNVE